VPGFRQASVHQTRHARVVLNEQYLHALSLAQRAAPVAATADADYFSTV
jgi:hypothetical protein